MSEHNDLVDRQFQENEIRNGSSVLVLQRQYGLVAPELDTNNVSRLITADLTGCFIFSLHDQVRKVGLMTHLDYASDLGEIAQRLIPELQTLGAGKVQIQTINFRPHFLVAKDIPSTLQKREQDMEEIINFLMDKGLLDREADGKDNVWQDSLWQGSNAIFDAVTGLRNATLEELQLTQAQQEYSDSYRERIRRYVLSGKLLSSFPFTCAYKPLLKNL